MPIQRHSSMASEMPPMPGHKRSPSDGSNAFDECDFHLQFSKRLKIGCDWGSAASLLGSGRGGGLGRPWSAQEEQRRSRQQQQCGSKALGGLSTMTMDEEDVSDQSDCEILDLDALARARSQCATPHASGGSSSALVGSSGRSPSPTSFIAAFMPKKDGDSVSTMILYRSPSPVQFERRGNDMNIVSFDGGHHHDMSVAIYSQPQRRPFLLEEAIDPNICFPNSHPSAWVFSGGSSFVKPSASRRGKGKKKHPVHSHGVVNSSGQGGFNFSPFSSIEVHDWGAFSRGMGQEGSMFMFSGVSRSVDRYTGSSGSASIMSLD